MRIIVPVATWQPKFQNRPFMIPIQQTDENALEDVLKVLSSVAKRFRSP